MCDLPKKVTEDKLTQPTKEIQIDLHCYVAAQRYYV